MRIEFTEYTPNDPEYNADPAFRFAGYITVTAESLADTKAIVDHFKLFGGDDPESLIARANALQDPALVHVHRPTKRPYFEVSGTLPLEYFQPYKDWANRVFGFDGAFPNLAIPFKWDGLRHVYYGIRQQIECHETVCFTVAIRSQPWNGLDAQDYADRNANRYIAEDFAHRPPTPEFLPNKNGTYRRNPKYGTGHREPLIPRLENETLCLLFVDWWLKNAASDAQREILVKNRELAELTGPYSLVNWLRGYDIRYVDPAGPCNYDGKGLMTGVMRMSDFAKLA